MSISAAVSKPTPKAFEHLGRRAGLDLLVQVEPVPSERGERMAHRDGRVRHRPIGIERRASDDQLVIGQRSHH
jgi:hypothetical protein